jgi:hypothetical protein
MQESIMWAAGKILHKTIVSIAEEPDEDAEYNHDRNILFFNELGMHMTAHADPDFDWDPNQRYTPESSLPYYSISARLTEITGLLIGLQTA